MAELNLSTGKPRGRHLQKKMPVRVDLTAMVDLAFLLITFFMLTTSLAKARIMPVVMPADGPPGFVAETSTMTICLGNNNKAMYYLGLADKPIIAPTVIGYGRDIRMAIIETAKHVKAATGKDLMVIIKPDDHSKYANLVDVLDEVSITKVPSYAIAKIQPADINLLKAKGIF